MQYVHRTHKFFGGLRRHAQWRDPKMTSQLWAVFVNLCAEAATVVVHLGGLALFGCVCGEVILEGWVFT